MTIGGSSYDDEWWTPSTGSLFPSTHAGGGADAPSLFAPVDGEGAPPGRNQPVLGRAGWRATELSRFPQLGWAIVTCMDSRVDTTELFGGIGHGDAHVIRNAGGVVTDDTIRSLAISQRLGRTSSIFLVHHTDCALSTITDREFADQLARETGSRPTWNAEAFTDAEWAVRRSMEKVEASPFIPRKHAIRGFVYDVTTGDLREVRRRPVAQAPRGR